MRCIGTHLPQRTAQRAATWGRPYGFYRWCFVGRPVAQASLSCPSGNSPSPLPAEGQCSAEDGCRYTSSVTAAPCHLPLKGKAFHLSVRPSACHLPSRGGFGVRIAASHHVAALLVVLAMTDLRCPPAIACGRLFLFYQGCRAMRPWQQTVWRFSMVPKWTSALPSCWEQEMSEKVSCRGAWKPSRQTVTSSRFSSVRL